MVDMSTPHCTIPSFELIKMQQRQFTSDRRGYRSLLPAGFYPQAMFCRPERVLCEHFGISRMTLRQAMKLLDREGLINSAGA